ncbi:MAG: transcriptional repressor LexA [Candidatus Paceibacterota bacterium]|jgi:repressor LexA
MKLSITTRQKELLQIIYDFIKNTGFPPSFEEMRENLKVASNQSIIDLLGKLEKSQTLKRSEGSARSIKITPLGFKILGKQMFPMVGISSAGPFTESFQDVEFKWMEVPTGIIPEEKIKRAEDVFIVQVHGDSMINANINDGDKLLIQKSKSFKNGDIVVARNSDGTTVKRFMVEGSKIFLKPENPNYDIIKIIPEEIVFEGKVILNLSTIN